MNKHANAKEVLDAVSCMDAAEYLGLETQRRGSRVVIRCPFHESILGRADRNIGNCVISENGRSCRCYSCGGYGSAIKMVMSYKGIGFCEATDSLAAAYAPGLIGENRIAKAPSCPIKRDEFALIGLKTNGVYKPVAFYDTKYDFSVANSASYQAVYDEAGVMGEKYENDTIIRLYEEDREMFLSIVYPKCEERIRFLRDAKEYMAGWMYLEGMREAAMYIDSVIQKIEDIICDLAEDPLFDKVFPDGMMEAI